MLFAIALTRWHTQSYQLLIHNCRNRRQQNFSFLLQLFQVRTYLRHPLVSYKPFHGIVNTPSLFILYLRMNEMKKFFVSFHTLF